MKRLLPLLGAFLLCLLAAPLGAATSNPDVEADRKPKPKPRPRAAVAQVEHVTHGEARRALVVPVRVAGFRFPHVFHRAALVVVVPEQIAPPQVQAPAPAVVPAPAPPSPAPIPLSEVPTGCQQLAIVAPAGHAWFFHALTGRRFLVRLH